MKRRRLHIWRVLPVVCAAVWYAPCPAVSQTGAGAQLQATVARLARVPGAAAGATLVVQISQEGHWTFANLAGETFTAATAAEVKRAFEVLLPDLGSRKPAVHLAGGGLFEQSNKIAELPRDAELMLAWGGESYRLLLQGDGAGAKYLTEVKPNLLIELNSKDVFGEAMQQLARPLERSAFRVLSIEPGGPRTFSAVPRINRAAGRAEIDAMDPAFLAAALSALRGQTAVIVGRLEGESLLVKPAAGPDRTLKWSELVATAEANDVNLLVLKAASAQQPGGRNWLWQKVEVKGLDHALGHATLADFFDALGGPGNRLVLVVERTSAARTQMDLRQAMGLPAAQSGAAQIGIVLSDVVSGLAGKVVHQGALAHFRSVSRDVELSRRIVPFVPSLVQWAYGGLLLLGLAGAKVSWRWWKRVWPKEKSAEYPSTAGYVAARTVRGLVFGALFMPAVAVAAAPLRLLNLLDRTAVAPAAKT